MCNIIYLHQPSWVISKQNHRHYPVIVCLFLKYCHLAFFFSKNELILEIVEVPQFIEDSLSKYNQNPYNNTILSSFLLPPKSTLYNVIEALYEYGCCLSTPNCFSRKDNLTIERAIQDRRALQLTAPLCFLPENNTFCILRTIEYQSE